MGIVLVVRRLVVVVLAVTFVLCLPNRSAVAEIRVDWQRGLLIGTGASAGDLRSPNRRLARVKAERQARKRCRVQIMAAAKLVTKAESGSVVDDPSRFESFVENLMTLSTDFGSDGSVVVEMALPLDTLRAFAYGADKPAEKFNGKAKILLIDARKLKLRPAIGFQLYDGNARYRGPTLFFPDSKRAKMHPGIASTTDVIVATKRLKGVLYLPENALAGTAGGRPLVAILWSEKKQ